MKLKILSWNIWCDGDFEKIKKFLHASRADIIGLQEVMPEDKERDVVAFLSKLGYYTAVAPMGATFPDGRMITSAIFSTYPIRTARMHMLSEQSPRQAVEAHIIVGNTTLTVFSFHLKHTHQQESTVQNLQMENLIKVLPKERFIAMGDCNATPDMTPIKRMREVSVDTDPNSHPTLDVSLFDCSDCDPALLPQTRLDYIFTSKDLKTRLPKVERSEGSDHLAISVVVELT